MSRGLGRIQRAALQELVRSGPTDATGLVLDVYDCVDDDDVYVHGPAMRRALYGLERSGLVARHDRVRTWQRGNGVCIRWIATDAGEALAHALREKK